MKSISNMFSKTIQKSQSDVVANPYYYDPDLPVHADTPSDSGLAQGQVNRRANATFVMLARNSDVDSAVRSVREVQDRFNKKFGYPWIFLNEEPFSDEFKK